MSEPLRDPHAAPRPDPARMARKCRIEVEEHGEILSPEGPLFLDALNRRGIDLHNDCGGYGKCGKCKIVFLSPAPECLPGDIRLLKEEERAAGTRLACYHQIPGGLQDFDPATRRNSDLLDNL